MALTFNTIPTKTLKASITAASTLLKLNNILDWNGDELTPSYLGGKLYAVLRNFDNSQIEIMELDPTTIANNSTSGITILYRGLKFNGDLTTEVSGYKKTWIKDQTIVEIGSDVPQIFRYFVDTLYDQTIDGIKTFSLLPVSNGGNAISGNQLITYAQALSILTGGGSVNQQILAGTAGETITKDQLVYLKVSDGRWWLADADTASTVENVILGIAQGAGTAGNSITNGVLISGLATLTAFTVTANTKYYASNTAGGISSSAGTTEVTIGYALSTTTLFFNPGYDQKLTEDQQDALTGTSGTPSSTNKYTTENDTSNSATITASTISFTASTKTIADSGNGFVTANFRAGDSIIVTGTVSNNGTYTIVSVASGVIVVVESLVDESSGSSFTLTTVTANKLARYSSTSQLKVPLVPVSSKDATSKDYVDNNFSLLTESLLAGESIKKNDMVYMESSDTVIRYRPTGVISTANLTSSVSTAFGGATVQKGIAIDSTTLLFISGGFMDGSNAGVGKAVISTVDSNGQISNNGTAVAYTANSVASFDFVLLNSSTFLVIWQEITAGPTASGIKCRIGSISGTTITFPTGATTIETTGTTTSQVASAFIDSSSTLITYRKDADTKLYTQVLSISGTTISSNTAVLVDTNTALTTQRVVSISIDTNKILLSYETAGSPHNSYLSIITISSTTPTVNTPVSFKTGSNTNRFDFSLTKMTTTKVVGISSQLSGSGGAPYVITISGTTPSVSSSSLLNFGSIHDGYIGTQRVSDTVIAVSYQTNSGTTLEYSLWWLNNSGTITAFYGDGAGQSTVSSSCLVFTRPFRAYAWYFDTSTSSGKIATYSQPNPNQIGIAQTDIAQGANGNIAYRYNAINNFTGLTGASQYYINTDGQPTLLTSSATVTYGTAINSTKMFVN